MAGIPPVPDGPPVVALASIVASVLIAALPLVVSRIRGGRGEDPGRHRAGAPDPPAGAAAAPAALPAAVDASAELVGRLVDGLTRRAETAEARLEHVQDELDTERREAFARQLEWQREIDALRSEIAALRAQLAAITHRWGAEAPRRPDHGQGVSWDG